MIRTWVKDLKNGLVRWSEHHLRVPIVVKEGFTRAVIMLDIISVRRNIDVLIYIRLDNQSVNVVLSVIICKDSSAIHRLIVSLKHETTMMHPRDIEVKVCVL